MQAQQPERLPPGRHGLTREQVARSQRGRLLRAMAQTTAAKGYARTTVSDVLRAAGVSRETFYEQFENKQDCFMSAYDAAVEIVLAGGPGSSGREAPREPTTRFERFDAALASYLDTLASEPEFARLFLVEVYAVGSEAVARRMQAQTLFVSAASEILRPRDATERFAVELMVAGVGSLVTARLAEGDAAGIRSLRRPIGELVRRALGDS